MSEDRGSASKKKIMEVRTPSSVAAVRAVVRCAVATGVIPSPAPPRTYTCLYPCPTRNPAASLGPLNVSTPREPRRRRPSTASVGAAIGLDVGGCRGLVHDLDVLGHRIERRPERHDAPDVVDAEVLHVHAAHPIPRAVRHERHAIGPLFSFAAATASAMRERYQSTVGRG